MGFFIYLSAMEGRGFKTDMKLTACTISSCDLVKPKENIITSYFLLRSAKVVGLTQFCKFTLIFENYMIDGSLKAKRK